jgi:hypothetical protein
VATNARVKRFYLEGELQMLKLGQGRLDDDARAARIMELEAELVALPALPSVPKPGNGSMLDRILGDRPESPPFETRETNLHVSDLDSDPMLRAYGDSIK